VANVCGGQSPCQDSRGGRIATHDGTKKTRLAAPATAEIRDRTIRPRRPGKRANDATLAFSAREGRMLVTAMCPFRIAIILPGVRQINLRE
jgi:hypothetical protein